MIAAGGYVFWDASRPFQTVDEYWYAEVVRNMLETGDLLTPRLGDRPEWIKPPLFYWLSVPFVAVTPSLELGMRWLPGLAFLATIWLAFRIAHQRLTVGAAPLAALIFLLTYDHLHIHGARNAVIDSVVNLELAIAFALNLRMWTHRNAIRWIGPVLAMVFLTKSAVVALPLGFTLVNLFMLRGRGPSRRDLAMGAGYGLLIGLPWFAAVVAIHGRAVIDTMFLDQVLYRVLDNKAAALTMPGRMFGRPEPLSVLQHLGTYAQPWVLLIPPIVLSLWGDRRRELDDRTHALRLAAAWAAVVVFVFLVTRASWPWHSNSIHMPIALLAADLLSRFLRRENSVALDYLVVAGAMAGLFLLRAPFLHDPFATLPVSTQFDSALLMQIGVLFVLAGSLFLFCRRRGLPNVYQMAALAVVPLVGVVQQWGFGNVMPVIVTVIAITLLLTFGLGERDERLRRFSVIALLTVGACYLTAPLLSSHRWDPLPKIAKLDTIFEASGAPTRNYLIKGAQATTTTC